MKPIILLAGRSRSGKDAVADYLVQNHNYVKLGFADPIKDIVSLLFGLPRPLLEDQDFKARPIPALSTTIPVTPRDLLQRIGTEGFNDDPLKFQKVLQHLKELPFDLLIEAVSIAKEFPRVKIEDIHLRYEVKKDEAKAIQQGQGFRSLNPLIWSTRTLYETIEAIELGQKVVIKDCRFDNELEAFNRSATSIYIHRPALDLEAEVYKHQSESFSFKSKCDYQIENDGSLEDLFYQIEQLIKK